MEEEEGGGEGGGRRGKELEAEEGGGGGGVEVEVLWAGLREGRVGGVRKGEGGGKGLVACESIGMIGC